jgi:hypothetical protein
MLTSHAGALMPHIPAPPPNDPYFAFVVLLQHFDNDDEQPYPDFSSYLRETTQTGLLATDTVDQKFGAGSGIFDGTNYSACASSINFGFGGDWTIECFTKRTGQSSGVDPNVIYANVSSGGGTQLRYLCFNPVTGKYAYRGPGGLLTDFVADATMNVWTHLAITRQGDLVRAFQAGVLQFSAGGDNSPAAAHAITVGGALVADWGANHGFVGELDEMRVTNGVARYTADFTPPTAAFPNE